MYVKFQMPLIAVSDVGRSKRFYCGLFDQRVVLDFGENVTFSGGFAIQEKFAWLTGLAEDSVRSRPNNMELYFEADDLDAALIHEAAIGKIAGEQIIKLMTLGLTEQEAEEQIISGFLK